MSKRVLVLAGNPKEKSFSNKLAEIYADAAKKSHEVRVLKLSDMDFNPDLFVGYDDKQDLEKSLEYFQTALAWSDHFVIIAPIWWGTVPAKLKGLIDRTFLPGFAFSYESGNSKPIQLLSGKTARIIMTMDTPPWYYRLVQGAPALKQLAISTLKFAGFISVKNTMLGPMISATEASKIKWASVIEKLGERAQ